MISIDLTGEKNLSGHCPYCGDYEYFTDNDTKLVISNHILSQIDFNETANPFEYDAVVNTCLNGHNSVFYNGIQYKII